MRSKTISQATVEGKKVADIHVGEMMRGLGTGAQECGHQVRTEGRKHWSLCAIKVVEQATLKWTRSLIIAGGPQKNNLSAVRDH